MFVDVVAHVDHPMVVFPGPERGRERVVVWSEGAVPACEDCG